LTDNFVYSIRAANDGGEWYEAGAVCDHYLVSRFYQTAWFYLICLGLGVGLLAGGTGCASCGLKTTW
jgi:hypothetical protein